MANQQSTVPYTQSLPPGLVRRLLPRAVNERPGLTQSEPRHRRRGWIKRATGELLIIFVGVTAAFIVEGYRQELSQRAEVRQATEGILTELRRYQVSPRYS
jgi:hypothetical protein